MKIDPEDMFHLMDNGFYGESNSKGVLNGSVASLSSAFEWSRTIQGHDYWYDITRGSGLIAPEDKQYILGVLRYKGGSYG